MEDAKGKTTRACDPAREAQRMTDPVVPMRDSRRLAVNQLDCDLIGKRLRDRSLSTPADELAGHAAPAPHPAAVLLPLFQLDRRWRLLLIRRTEHPTDLHSGQVGFPGGRVEPTDANADATALREAEEEIALPAERVRVLGRLRQLRTVSNFLVQPVVGFIPWPQPLRAEPGEVARIFSIPLDWLAAPSRYRVEVWPGPNHRQGRRVVFFDQHEGQLLWGVSARITLDLLDALGFLSIGEDALPIHD
jgi:8-oxo-dGTP pyrophosphatase MutT (NUDIX family)